MRKVFFIFLFFLFLFFLVGTLAPFVSATCSLGANPLHASANVKPGETVEVKWNFYNLYGDRITHVLVSKSEGPDWDINYKPDLHEAEYDVSGVIEKIEENLFIEKKDVALVIPSSVPEGEVYLKHPKQEGYIPAKELKIYIEVPEDAELWKDYKFIFNSNGNCFSEPGTVVPGVATQLEVTIRTTTEYYEKPVGQETKTTKLGQKILDLISEPTQMSPVAMIATGTSLILIIVLVVLIVMMRGKGSKKKGKKKGGKGK